MKKKLNRGFTLIELLVVIAIIGILASVILASLDSARSKGTDAATESDLDNARAQAELFYDANNSYTNTAGTVCAQGTAANGINAMLVDAANKINGGAPVYNTATTSATVTCNVNSTGSAWAATVPLKSVGTTAQPLYFCVDSAGNAAAGKVGGKTEALASGATVCP